MASFCLSEMLLMSSPFWLTRGDTLSSTPLACSLFLWTLMKMEWMPFSRLGHQNVNLMFISVPFLFQMHLTTAPTYFHFPPSGKRKPEDKFDIARLDSSQF